MTTATLCTVFAVILALGQVVVARHRAGGAADLAALAAADRALEGAAVACRAAREVAGAQGAEVVRCAVQGEIADVAARVRLGPYAPEVRSRAGPAATAPVETGPAATAPVVTGPAATTPVTTASMAPAPARAAAAVPAVRTGGVP
ncbi:Rv3654c family TadE-like protein [Streptomyces sp. NPDC058382]|uniref:Rv3654c family TadE-like protein n=1 Tax=unclassified Streptomyces TaxID=2593676 RepID=UPI0036377F33